MDIVYSLKFLVIFVTVLCGNVRSKHTPNLRKVYHSLTTQSVF